MYKIAFDTFGCRLNQAETATLHDRFRARGYEVTGIVEEADLFVVNTCTLTSQAAAKCRRRIRSAIRRNPDACVAAIGCYAQTDAAALAQIEGLDYIVGTADKLRLAEIIDVPVKLPSPQIIHAETTTTTFTIDGAGYYPSNTRANIKVQEGCDFVCAFCLIPRSRGRARSRQFDDIVREATMLAASGHRELVVTGVNIGTYRDGRYRLPDVLTALGDIDGLDRVRLSSIEPTTISDTIVRQMESGTGKLCPYLHVPLQSGDDGVLAAMRRRYTAAQYRGFIENAAARVPNLGLGTDVIVGFPGEDSHAFQRSAEVIQSLPYTHVHVFSFSARPRTSAYAMAGRVEPGVIRMRSEQMHRLAESRKAEYYAAQKNHRLRVLCETRGRGTTYYGFADNYVRVRVNSENDVRNKLIAVRATGVSIEESGNNLVVTAVRVGREAA